MEEVVKVVAKPVISADESRRDIDKLKNMFARIFSLKCAYLDELNKLDNKAKQLLLDDLRSYRNKDAYANRVLDELDTSYRGRSHQIDSYFKSLIERLKTFMMKVAVEMLDETFQLLSSLEKKYHDREDILGAISEHRKSLNKLNFSIVDEYADHLRYEFCKQYRAVETIQERNALIRANITARTRLIDRWEQLLPAEKRFLGFESDFNALDLSAMDLSGLDLRRSRFAGCCFRQTDLRNSTCVPDQFLHSRSMGEAVMDAGMVDEVLAQKKNRTSIMRKELEENFLERQEQVDALRLLPRLVCLDKLPNLEDISAKILQMMVVVLIGTGYINKLPDEDEFSIKSLSIKPSNLDLTGKTRAELLAIYERILKARGMKLSEEVLLYAREHQFSAAYERLEGEHGALERFEWLISGLPLEVREEHEKFIAEKREVLRDLKKNKEKHQREYLQASINAFITHLHKADEEDINLTPSTRIGSALDGARKRDDVVVDLTGVELTKELLAAYKGIDFSFVHVILTSAQEKVLPWKYREQRYVRLMQAVENEDLREIAVCCRQGLSVNHLNEAGRSPFMKACAENRATVVDFMLQRCGAKEALKSQSPNETAGQWSVLETALVMGNDAVADALIKHGAEVSFIAAVMLDRLSAYNGKVTAEKINAVYLGGTLPLFVAIRKKHRDLVSWLLQNGADVRLQEGQKTALKEAVLSGDLGIVKTIHKCGGVITLELIRLACEKDFLEIAQYFTSEAPDKIDLYSALFVKRPQHEIDKQIKGDCKTVQPDGLTPLATACFAGNADAVRDFLRRGADDHLYIPSKRHTSPGSAEIPLFYATMARRADVVEYLVHQEGVSPTTIVKESTSPLAEAVRRNFTDIVMIMLRPNSTIRIAVNLDAQDASGNTVLSIAVRNGAVDVVKALLESGASPYIADSIGNLPLHYARSEGLTEIAEILEHAMLNPKNKHKDTPKEVAKKARESAPVSVEKAGWDAYFDSVAEIPVIPERITQGNGYVCHEAIGDGECGLSRAFKIPGDAIVCKLLVDKADEAVFNLLQPAVVAALATKEFQAYLVANHIMASSGDCAARIDIIMAYLDYNLKDRQVALGWMHPAVLQAIAHVQGIALYMWGLDEGKKLILYKVAEQRNYAEFIPEGAMSRVDLLWSGDHFNWIELNQRLVSSPSAREHFGSPRALLAPPSPRQQGQQPVDKDKDEAHNNGRLEK
ncbi:MAG TPA: ankyrin repeat domain-containing protein [Gammaproteobacteria bacterium]|nr:ankyrin repeat domain-containing protein [Gammaproteobacteria bacterium]